MFLNIKEIEAAELANWITERTDDLHIVDVREIFEIQAGTIHGAKAMPLATIPLKMTELDKDKTTVMVCRSGARSAQACAYLQQRGFDNVVNLRGGMFAWAGAGKPIGQAMAG